MKKVLKFFGVLILLVIVCIAGVLTYLKTAFPKVKAAQVMKIAATPEILKRGSYLANHVCLCVDCHSARDITKYGMPLIQGTIGQGGQAFDHAESFPGS